MRQHDRVVLMTDPAVEVPGAVVDHGLLETLVDQRLLDGGAGVLGDLVQQGEPPAGEDSGSPDPAGPGGRRRTGQDPGGGPFLSLIHI